MDDGLIVSRLKLNFGNGKETQILNFLDIKVEEDLIIKRGIYCKPTNIYDYLPHDSVYPEHAKSNIPFGLAKRMIVLVSNPEFGIQIQ